MARKIDEEETEHPAPGEGGLLRGTVKRLFETGAASSKVASSYLADQFGGWKADFLGIFQSELRRFLDRLDASEEMKKFTAGKRLEISIRLVDDSSSSHAPKKPKKKR